MKVVSHEAIHFEIFLQILSLSLLSANVSFNIPFEKPTTYIFQQAYVYSIPCTSTIYKSFHHFTHNTVSFKLEYLNPSDLKLAMRKAYLQDVEFGTLTP